MEDEEILITLSSLWRILRWDLKVLLLLLTIEAITIPILEILTLLLAGIEQ